MAQRSRRDWIEEGFRILASEGDAGLTVDALCERLDRSKGSFYHHFEGRPGYVEDVLAAWERQATDRIISVLDADPGSSVPTAQSRPPRSDRTLPSPPLTDERVTIRETPRLQ